MVGSLLRTDTLHQARAQHASGALNAAALKAIEDREIGASLDRQEAIGLQSATDGEFRRAFWHFDFLSHLEGCALVDADHGIQFHGVQTKAKGIALTGRIGWPADHPMLSHFRFLKANTHL